jgi:hypothetical protein
MSSMPFAHGYTPILKLNVAVMFIQILVQAAVMLVLMLSYCKQPMKFSSLHYICGRLQTLFLLSKHVLRHVFVVFNSHSQL